MNEKIANGEPQTGSTTLNLAGAVAWLAGGQVGSAPFNVAAEHFKGTPKVALLSTGAVIDAGFNFGAMKTLVGNLYFEDIPGIVVGSAVGALTGPFGALAAGIVADQTLGRLFGLVDDISNLEDPDGGFNGAGMVSPGYGSARAPSDTDGRGVGIRRGDEENALDQIARETQELGLKIPAWSKPDWTDPAADPLDLGLTAAPGHDSAQGYDLYHGFDHLTRSPHRPRQRHPQTARRTANPAMAQAAPPAVAESPAVQTTRRRRITKPPIIIPVAEVAVAAAARMAVV